MGYLYLFIALLGGATKGFCGKKTSKYTQNLSSAVLVNFVRMILCVIISAVIIAFSGTAFSVTAKTLGICVLSGIFMSSFVVSWLFLVRGKAYMTVDVSLTAGTIIPIVASSILWNEQVRVTQWMGVGLLFVSVIIMCSYNNSIKEKFSLSSVALLIVCGASGGLSDLTQKMFVNFADNESVTLYNFYTYLFSALILLTVYFVMPKKNGCGIVCTGKERCYLSAYLALMAACMFVNVFFKTRAASELDAVLIYPLHQGGSMFLSSLMSAMFFKERITLRAVAGVIIAFVSLLIINVL